MAVNLDKETVRELLSDHLGEILLAKKDPWRWLTKKSSGALILFPILKQINTQLSVKNYHGN